MNYADSPPPFLDNFSKLLQALLSEVTQRKASDLHVSAGMPPMMRITGDLEPSKSIPALSPEQTRGLAYSIMREDLRTVFEERREVDFSFSVSGAYRYRVNVYSQRGWVNIALRVVPVDIPSIAQLGLPASIETLAEERRGLILVTGTTGCGKTTTLAAIIQRINETRKAHIITIEDPIEYLHSNKKSVVDQRELGLDTLSYADALRHVVRQDPNVVLIGEMRDQETMAAAITCAQTGQLVLSTVHTTDTVQTVNRIVDLFPPHQHKQIRIQLAETLKGIISQRLLPRTDQPGRIAAVEILLVTPLIGKALEENNLSEVENALKKGRFYGMQSFNHALLELYNQGKVTLEDALAAAGKPEELMMTVRGVQSGGMGSTVYDPGTQ